MCPITFQSLLLLSVLSCVSIAPERLSEETVTLPNIRIKCLKNTSNEMEGVFFLN
nr:hypothetical protein [uncultured bacterium]